MTSEQGPKAEGEEPIAVEEQRASEARRTRMLKLGSIAFFVAIIAVVVVIVVAGNSSTAGGNAGSLIEIKRVDALLKGIPQRDLVLGRDSAPVELIEYGDLQCPVCKEYSEEFLPPVIEKRVRNGEAKIVFRNFTIISQQSIPAGQAAIAAGAQGRGWNFIELFYRNQGEERSGYVTDAFIESIARGAGVEDMARFNEERRSQASKEEVTRTREQAEAHNFDGTPSFLVEGPGTKGAEAIPLPQSVGELEAAIARAR